MKFFLKSNKGMTLAVAVIMIAIVFLFTVIVLTLNDNLTRNVNFKVNSEDALQIAEAGYNHYMYYLNQDSEFYKNADGIHIAGAGSEELGFVPETTDSDGLPISYKTTTYISGERIIGYYKITIDQPSFNQYLTVYSTGWSIENPNIIKTVRVQIHRRSFAEYVDFSDKSGDVWWTTGDKAFGPVFCNDNLNIDGDPEFYDDVIIGGVINKRSGSNPKYFESVLTNQPKMIFPVSNNDIVSWGEAKNGGLTFSGRTCIYLDETSIKVRNKTNGDTLTTYNLPQSGVLVVKNNDGNAGNVFISGKLNGRLTVYAQGNVYITGRNPTNFTPPSSYERINTLGGIFYSDDNIPKKSDTGNNFSDDMLGIISEMDIIIATRTWPSSSTDGFTTDKGRDVSFNNITVYGALMTNTAGKQIKVEYYDSIPVKGKFTVIGSKIQNAERGAVGTFYSGTDTQASGYRKVNTFDYRLKTISPPHFIEPDKSGWEVKSWEEVNTP